MEEKRIVGLEQVGGFAMFVQATGDDEFPLNDSASSVIAGDEEAAQSPWDDLGDHGDQSSSKTSSEFFSPVNGRDSIQDFLNHEAQISQEERTATAPVEGILEKLNWASSHLNDCEQQIVSLELKKSAVAAEWRNQKVQLLNSIGRHVIDRAKPVFEAYEQQLQLQVALNEAAELYHEAVSELEKIKEVLVFAHDNGSSEEQLGVVLQQSVNAQTKRDSFEHLSLERTAEYKQAQAKCIELRKLVGLRTVERAWPWFEGFIQSKSRSQEFSQHIHRLKVEAARLREEYRECMQQLEAISAKVHSIRQDQNPPPED